MRNYVVLKLLSKLSGVFKLKFQSYFSIAKPNKPSSPNSYAPNYFTSNKQEIKNSTPPGELLLYFIISILPDFCFLSIYKILVNLSRDCKALWCHLRTVFIGLYYGCLFIFWLKTFQDKAKERYSSFNLLLSNLLKLILIFA